MNSDTAAPLTTAAPARLRLLHPVEEDNRFPVLGVGVNSHTFDDAVGAILDAPKHERRMRVHFAAVHTFVEAAKDPSLRDSLNRADLIGADGMPIVWLGRLSGRKVERVCGPDTMLAVLDQGRKQGARHFFYGATEERLKELTSTLKHRYPGIEIAGTYAPPFRPLTWWEMDEVAATINAANADYVWVGLGSPKQDKWLAQFRPLLNAPVLLAVGAAFDFSAGRRKRAPQWAQRGGMEWLFRLASEPRRLAWRYTAMSIRFGSLLVADRLFRREVRA